MHRSGPMGTLWGRVFWLFLCLALPTAARADSWLGHNFSNSIRDSAPRSETPHTAGEIFSESYNSKDYVKGACPDNICRLAGRFRKAGLDLSKARVLFLFSKEKNDLYPQRAREGIAEWGFHTVLEYNGRIYDMDFRDDPVDVRPYFESNFVFDATERERVFQDIQVRPVPALDFLRDYDLKGGEKGKSDHQAYLQNSVPTRNYPAQSLLDFLAAQPPGPDALRQMFRAMPRIKP